MKLTNKEKKTIVILFLKIIYSDRSISDKETNLLDNILKKLEISENIKKKVKNKKIFKNLSIPKNINKNKLFKNFISIAKINSLTPKEKDLLIHFSKLFNIKKNKIDNLINNEK